LLEKSRRPASRLDISDEEACVLGKLFFVDICGTTGIKNADRFLQAYSASPTKALDLAAGPEEALRGESQPSRIQALEREMLLSMTLSIRTNRISQVLRIRQKVNVVRLWDALGRAAKENPAFSKQLYAELARIGYQARASEPLRSRVLGYLSGALGLKRSQISDRLYRYRLLAVMVDVFGEGIYPYLPDSLEMTVKKLKVVKYSEGEDGSVFTKADKFKGAVEVLHEVFPALGELCQVWEANVIQRFLQGQPPTLSTRSPGHKEGLLETRDHFSILAFVSISEQGEAQ